LVSVQQVWQAVDGHRLKALREARGWDVSRLAQLCALSAAQIRQLEDGGESQFYSTAIKALAGRRALTCLESAATRSAGDRAPLVSAAHPASPATTPQPPAEPA
jgi:transcriptional regulator with XRE-family HTH domain